MSVIAITGSSGKIGCRLIERLAREHPEKSILAIDIKEPTRRLPQNIDFCRLDVRNPLLGELLAAKGVDTIIHLAFSVIPIHNSTEMHEINLVSTLNLLSACSKTNIKNIIIVSSSFVYGFHPDNCMYMTEDLKLRPNRKFQYLVDKVELERYAVRFGKRNPDTRIVILRPAIVPGSRMAYYLKRYFKMKLSPTLMGYDPLFQFLHMDDFLESLVRSINLDVHGIFNVAAPGLISLSGLGKLLRKYTIPLPGQIAFPAADMLWYMKLSSGRGDIMSLLRYSCLVGFNKYTNTFGTIPVKTVRETALEWAAGTESYRRSIFGNKDSFSLQQLIKTFQEEFDAGGREKIMGLIRKASQGIGKFQESNK